MCNKNGQNETHLKPCPCCGSDDVGVYWRCNCFAADCADCGLTIERDTEWEVIAAWNTRVELVSGTLTADDVRDLIERHSDASGGNGRDFHNGAYEVIADELNTRTERTCHMMTDEGSQYWHSCSSCGCDHYSQIDYPHCPNCGARVVGGEGE